jgi:hypothetical protein
VLRERITVGQAIQENAWARHRFMKPASGVEAGLWGDLARHTVPETPAR